MSLRALNSLERGEAVNPHYATLTGIADALGMSISELLGEPEPVGKAQAPPESGEEERRYLILLLDSYTSIMKELIDGHGAFLDNLSRDLATSTSFAVFQRVAEFLHVCDVIESALLDEGSVAQAADSVWTRVDEGEDVPEELKVRVAAFQKTYDQLFMGVRTEALDWVESQQNRPEVMEYYRRERRESEKRRAGGDVIDIAHFQHKRSETAASAQRAPAEGAG